MKKKIKGTEKKPRLYIFKSNKHIYAQLIDDASSQTITIISSNSINIKKNHPQLNKNCITAKVIGYHVAEKCQQLGITQIVFDRGSQLYHGHIKALADATREKGIEF